MDPNKLTEKTQQALHGHVDLTARQQPRHQADGDELGVRWGAIAPEAAIIA